MIYNKKISIVIPAYNVENYIDKCLGSVTSQTYTNLEIIVVNDGSTDNTHSIIKKYISDKRIVYINQKNSGVSAARNAGIDASTGELIAFVDSDDYVEPDMYELLYTSMTETSADMAVCNYNLVYDNRVENQYSKMSKRAVDIQSDIYGYFATHCARPQPNNYIWTRLYKTAIIKNSGIRFEDFKLGDDTLFNFKLLPNLNKASFIPNGLYNYYQRINSNVYTAAYKHNLAKVYADAFDSLENYWRENNFTEWISVLPIHAATRLRSVFFYSRLAGMNENEITQNIINGFSDRSIVAYLTGAR